MYQEHPPSTVLRDFVECYWTRRTQGPTRGRVLPDGCADILFENGDAHVVGTMTRPLEVSRSSATSFVAVRFRPGGAFPFLSCPLGELTDQRVALEDLWSDQAHVAERVTRGGVAALDSILAERLESAPEPRVAAAVQSIERSGGRARVSALGEGLGLSRQHLKRLFDQHVGVGVKAFSRVVRLQHVLRALDKEVLDWAELAVDMGYYDQAHLISDFNALTGETPSAFAASRR